MILCRLSFITYYFVYVYNLFISIFICYTVSVLFCGTYCISASFAKRQFTENIISYYYGSFMIAAQFCTNNVFGVHTCFDY